MKLADAESSHREAIARKQWLFMIWIEFEHSGNGHLRFGLYRVVRLTSKRLRSDGRRQHVAMFSKNNDMPGLLAFCLPLRFGLIFEIVYDARSKNERATADPA